MELTRRELLTLAAAAPLWAQALQRAAMIPGGGVARPSIDGATGFVMGLDGGILDGIDLVREWSGPYLRTRAVSRRKAAARVKEIVLFDVPLSLPSSTGLYGEGFQMLSQTGGTLGQPANLSQYTDEAHYKIPITPGARAFYGLLALAPPDAPTQLLAFTSCARFAGRFEIKGASLRAVMETDGLELRPGETWALEELMVAADADRAGLFARVADRLAQHHPPLRTAAPPTGWCSWYHFGANVTAADILGNLDVIAKQIPSLKYIQIDDGYQSAMGDWLDTGAAFGGSIRTVLAEIRKRGYEPAIWVAPFIAEASSQVFREHPGWFITDEAGAPLRADLVTFGGWRRGPWYALDGTHPEVQRHFEQVFRTMRTEWGCTYFKLDANFWGAMHGGHFHDPRATRVEAYRRGMQAIVRGAGHAFLLGCNHPIWPSIGVVHGSRSSNDIKRTWERISTTARQNLNRNWQNGKLWWNDPDAVCLSGDLPENEFQFHATAIYASGGMVLSGDDLTHLPAPRLAILRKLLPPTGVAASFGDSSLRIGTIDLKTARMLCLFNWDDAPLTLNVVLPRPGLVTDDWTGEALGRREGTMSVGLEPHSAKLLRVRPTRAGTR